jgi:hypothetical protein
MLRTFVPELENLEGSEELVAEDSPVIDFIPD